LTSHFPLLAPHSSLLTPNASPLTPDRADELLLVHLTAAPDVSILGDVVELLLAAALEAGARIAGALGGLVGRAPLLAPVLVHRAGGDLLGALTFHAALAVALLDVLVHPLVFAAPGSRHGLLLWLKPMKSPNGAN